ncbi:MAG: penicillin-binding protein [Bacteroidetes bacterium CG12_big_fil_rev_8_21_14_0_65_60_17]|nr:MAG: penicillin-binding protein [Bacteroidetes bacterium CG12_big_fil_rev_8_21_14_0_65_60_17]
MLRRLLIHIRNRYLLWGIALLLVVGTLLYLAVSFWLLPAYTQHGVAVTVPDLRGGTAEEALASLDRQQLAAEFIQLRKPNLPKGVVIDQSPTPESRVKPGRRIYVTVNSGDTTTVVVPNIEALPVREAQNQLMTNGLLVGLVQPDSIPSAHANTITRQDPEAGSRVAARTPVNLWFSTGLGDRIVTVPDVTGMTARQATVRLLEDRLRSVVLDHIAADGAEPVIDKQSPPPGTQVREGFEVRLHVAPDTE